MVRSVLALLSAKRPMDAVEEQEAVDASECLHRFEACRPTKVARRSQDHEVETPLLQALVQALVQALESVHAARAREKILLLAQGSKVAQVVKLGPVQVVKAVKNAQAVRVRVAVQALWGLKSLISVQVVRSRESVQTMESLNLAQVLETQNTAQLIQAVAAVQLLKALYLAKVLETRMAARPTKVLEAVQVGKAPKAEQVMKALHPSSLLATRNAA